MVKNKISLFTIFLLFIAVVFIRFSNPNWDGEGKNKYGILAWDNFGYYLYLPATFIYNDPGIEDVSWVHEIKKKYKPSTTLYQISWMKSGKYVIQYSMGMAVIYSPAFFTAHVFAGLSDKYPADGFSTPYQISILVYSAFLILLGLHLFRLFALRFFSDRLTTLIIIFLCIATNYFQIVTTNTISPHAILFTFYAALLYLTVLWHQKPNYKNTILFGLVLAIMTLSRPNELLFLIIPLLWGVDSISSFKEKIRLFLTQFQKLAVLGLILIAVGSLQLIYWKYTSGRWVFDSYLNEGFKLMDPYLTEYLFSYKKGWLLYTPIMAFGLLGFISLYRRKKELFWSFFLFTIINIWILSSWDTWWYADSFSQRSIVQSYPIFILPIGYLLYDILHFKRIVQYLFFTVFLGFMILNLFQTYQVKMYVIHPQRMTKEYYWAVFWDLNYDPEKAKLLEVDRNLNYLPENRPKKKYLVYHENFLGYKSNENFTYEGATYPKDGVLELTKDHAFSKKASFAYEELTDADYVFAVARVRYMSNYNADENPLNIVISTEDWRSHKTYKYRQRSIADVEWFEKGSWSSMQLVSISPYLRSKSDSLHAYMWLSGTQSVLIDNFSIEIYDPGERSMMNENIYINNFKSLTIGNWSDPGELISNKGYALVNKNSPYSSTLGIKSTEVDIANKQIEISCTGLSGGPNKNLHAVVSIERGNEKVHYRSFPMNLKNGKWVDYRFNEKLPENIPEGSILKYYIWNKSKKPFFIDELRLEIIKQ